VNKEYISMTPMTGRKFSLRKTVNTDKKIIQNSLFSTHAANTNLIYVSFCWNEEEDTGLV
jgi:hypothetical protein